MHVIYKSNNTISHHTPLHCYGHKKMESAKMKGFSGLKFNG